MSRILATSLALLAAIPLIQAAPTLNTRSAFSFASWVESIIDDPATAMSPDQAYVAWQSSANGTDPSTNSGLQKRWGCGNGSPASVLDAVNCINYLAGLNQQCAVDVQATFCHRGVATITGTDGIFPYKASSPCKDVARGAGSIMDHCTKPDGTVHGWNTAWGNGFLEVLITG